MLVIRTLRTVSAALAIALACSCGGRGAGVDEAPRDRGSEARDPRWARPVSRPGLPNLHEIEDGLYRGAQPEPEGFAQLRDMGVRTIVNLRSVHSDEDEIEEAGATGAFRVVSLPTVAWHVDEDQVVEFIRLAADPEGRPLFFHCMHGADRTGAMAAAYRMVVQGWSREEALREMRDGGYGFHPVWRNLEPFVEGLDVARVRRRAGLDETDAGSASGE